MKRAIFEPWAKPQRIVGDDLFLRTTAAEEIEAWRAHLGRETLDKYYIAAVETVSAAGFGSTRLLQSQLGIGYYPALILIEAMQKAGVLGEFDNARLRYELIEPRGFY